MSKRQSPNQAQPVVQRVRMRYSKTGRMRFGSARDFQRALERAVRRAAVPVAMSGGFNPHPRISYANAVPTGDSSLAEYVEIGLAVPMPPDRLADLINDGLPDGFRIVAAIESPGGGLADRLEASRWRIELPGRTREDIVAAVDRMLADAPVTVPRMTKSGTREIAVSDNWVGFEAEDAVLIATVRTATPTVRPDDVVRALHVGPAGACIRESQGPLLDGTVADPFDARIAKPAPPA